MIVESTYGDRLHGERPDYLGQLTTILQETFDKGGNVVIPSFAIGRTQELLYLLRTIKEKRLIRGHEQFPVYVDSPLAVEATRIYSAGLTDYYDQETLDLLAKGVDPINFNGLRLSVTADESKLINEDPSPKVILSASGMCEAGVETKHILRSIDSMKIENFDYTAYPVRFWDVYGKKGLPVRTTISEMGPELLSRLLGLNDTQNGILRIVFRIADERGLLLQDLKDLRGVAAYRMEQQILVLTDSGLFLRYDLAGEKLAEIESYLYSDDALSGLTFEREIAFLRIGWKLTKKT